MMRQRDRSSTYSAERKFLVDCVANCIGKYVLEIGALYGATTCALAEAAVNAGKHVVTIDPWDGTYAADDAVYDTFLENIEPYRQLVTVIRQRSDDADIPAWLLNSCCLVFIDGFHEGDQPHRDLVKFWPCVAVGGIVALHDYYSKRHRTVVQEAVRKFVEERPRPQSLWTLRYYPSRAEYKAHRQRGGEAGLAWIVKEAEE